MTGIATMPQFHLDSAQSLRDNQPAFLALHGLSQAMTLVKE
jgi:hypothetical protein